MLKALLLDIDNTLIQSQLAYFYALEQISEKWKKKYLGKEPFLTVFETYKKKLKEQFPNLAINRNRLLVFKEMAENGFFLFSPKLLIELEKDYFKFFKKEIKSQLKRHKTEYEEMFSLLREHSRSKEILFLSNESLRTQLLKLSWFFPEDIPFRVLTSEEIGVEKPSPLIYRKALALCGVQPQDAIMIGDSLVDDVEGAKQLGISAIHLTSIFGKRESVVHEKEGYIEHQNLNYCLEILLKEIEK